MARYGALWLAVVLPRFALEVLERGLVAAPPGALIAGDLAGARVVLGNAAAVSAGVQPGMRMTAALALAPELRRLDRDPPAEHRMLDGLAGWAMQFTSRVSPLALAETPVAGLRMEIGASLRLFGGLGALRRRIDQGLGELGYTRCMAIAPNPSAAWLLARAGGGRGVTEAAALPGVLASLPVAALDLAPQTLRRLSDMGVRRLAECRRLPRAPLARRLGPQLLDILDRAYGSRPDPLPVYSPPAAFEAALALPCEANVHEALLFAIQRLLRELSGRLLAHGLGAQAVVLELGHEQGAATHISFALAAPEHDAAALLELIARRLEREPLARPVVHVGLRLQPASLTGAPQGDLFATGPTREQLWRDVVQRLRLRLGEDALATIRRIPDPRPEHAFATSGKTLDCWPWRQPRRPMWLLDPARPLSVSDNRPVLDGDLRLVSGPERLEGGWWDGADIRRDYFIVENPSGQRFWVYHGTERPRRWYLHGIFA